ncbi:hypothetical protein SUGI_1098790 [Cryptomeria japonica]|uniref:oleosin G-like n=1 Tax=Cryptomeria japonica TaxID=3369 RepID=UPI002414AC20|nr:oleosin G-like [Cryptomeria japonica]GLJ51698.1 hypothetical protein SUGI_1098790 [Cryptomeria japonica]
MAGLRLLVVVLGMSVLVQLAHAVDSTNAHATFYGGGCGNLSNTAVCNNGFSWGACYHKSTTMLTSCANLPILMGLFVAGIVIFLLTLATLLILLSPILIPVGILLFMTVLGLFAVGIFGVTVILGFKWLYNYLKGRSPNSDGIAQRSAV